MRILIDAQEVQIVKEHKLVIRTQISNNLFHVTMWILDEGYGNHYIDFLLAASKVLPVPRFTM
jgi:hypothetical protein